MFTMDFTEVKDQLSLIPDNTVAKVMFEIQQPKNPSSDDPLIHISDKGSASLNVKYTVMATVDGKHLKRSFYDNIYLRSSDETISKNAAELQAKGWTPNPKSTKSPEVQLREAANKCNGMQTLKGILMSQRNLGYKDNGEEHRAKYNLTQGLKELSGQPLVVVIGVNEGNDGIKRNNMKFAVLKDSTKYKDVYAKFMGGASTASAAPSFGVAPATSAPATSPVQGATPSWM